MIFALASIFWLLTMVVSVVLGYVLKTRIVNNRINGIVDLILDDMQKFSHGVWKHVNWDFESFLKSKWSEVIKRGVQGYYQWLQYRSK